MTISRWALIDGEFKVRVGDLGVFSNHGANYRNSTIAAEIVRFHNNDHGTHHVVAFVERNSDGFDIRLLCDRVLTNASDWAVLRDLCNVAITLARMTRPES